MSSAMTGCPVCQRADAHSLNVPSAEPSTGGLEYRNHKDHGFEIDCKSCGRFIITRQDRYNISTASQSLGLDRVKVSALLRERSTMPLPTTWLRDGMGPYGGLVCAETAPVELPELLSAWPDTVGERLDRTLANLARSYPEAGQKFSILSGDLAAVPLCFAKNFAEARYYVNSLIGLGWLERDGENTDGVWAHLRPAGWERVEQLCRTSTSAANRVFVAMWFGTESGGDDSPWTSDGMMRSFLDGIEAGIELAQYRATRVDLAENNNDGIMDKVMGDIRVAPFVVADLTGNRNGVYWEAGFARGLGRPVIYTCARSHFKDAHFDVKHLNIIVWETVEELKKRLNDRIRGTIGLGPYPPKSS